MSGMSSIFFMGIYDLCHLDTFEVFSESLKLAAKGGKRHIEATRLRSSSWLTRTKESPQKKAFLFMKGH